MLQYKLARYKGKIIAVVAGLVVLASVISGAVAVYQDTGKVDVAAVEQIITAAEDVAEAVDTVIEAIQTTTTATSTP
jgi:chromate transport protein ChrA